MELLLHKNVVCHLVNLNMPLLGLLKSLNPLIIINTLGLANLSKHILDARHHTLQSTEIHVCARVQLGKDLIGIFLNLVLDVHLSTLLVLLFTREGIVQTEVIGEASLGILEFIIVKEGITVGNAQEEPGLTLVHASGGCILKEETTDETTEGGDTGTGGNHDVIGGGVLLGHEHDLTGGSSHGNLVTGGGVTQEVGADTLLGGVLGLKFRAPVGGTTNAEGSGLTGHVITVTGGGDGVKTNGVGLAVLLTVAGGDDTPGLTLDVGEITLVVDDDVAGLTGGLGSDDTLGGHDLTGEGGLVLVGVDLDSGVVVVGGVLEEVLFQVEGGSELGSRLGHKGRSTSKGSSEESNLHL